MYASSIKVTHIMEMTNWRKTYLRRATWVKYPDPSQGTKFIFCLQRLYLLLVGLKYGGKRAKKFPLKSHRKPIRYPDNSEELAELMGIVFGDGGINNPWQVVVTMNAKADATYSQYVASLFKRLFGIPAAIRERPKHNALVVVCSSTNVVDFLVKKGAVRGNKIRQHIDAPKWIMENPDFRRKFLRGLVDTDGCLYIHRHTVGGKVYKNLGFCFSSYAKNLLLSAATILADEGLNPHFARDNKVIYLYGKQTEEYLAKFGTSNPRITRVYELRRTEREGQRSNLSKSISSSKMLEQIKRG